MRPLRLGLIGAGAWGRNIIRTIQGLQDALLSRVASRNPETPGLAGPACAATTDWLEVACARDLDAVLVATPPPLHAGMVRAALEAGLPVFVEKPLTMSVAQALDLLDLAGRKGGFVLVDHVHLFHPAYESLKARAKTLGPVRAVHSEGGGPGPDRPDTPPLWDYGPHDAALCLDFLDAKPVSIQAQREGPNFRFRWEFPGGIPADVRVGNRFERKTRRFEVRFASKALVIDDRTADKLVLRGSGHGAPIAVEPIPPLTAALVAFTQAVRAGSKDLSSLKLGVDVVKLLAACEARLEL